MLQMQEAPHRKITLAIQKFFDQNTKLQSNQISITSKIVMRRKM